MYGCQHGPPWALELELWVSKVVPNLLLVNDAGKEVGVSKGLKFLVREEEHSQAVDVGEGHVVLADVALELVDDLLNRSPLCDVCLLKGHKLLL